jgi:hypothetical protein
MRACTSKSIAFVAIAALGLAACGGGSSGSSTASSSSKPTTTTKSAASVADDEIVKAASVQLADLGAGWTEYQKAGGFKAVEKGACNVKFGSPLTTSDQVYVGPMFRDATEQTYVYTNVVVFGADAPAKDFTTVRNTEEFRKCKEAEDNAAQKQRDPKTFVRLDNSPAPPLENGLESFYQEEAGVKGADGTDVVNASYARYSIRVGRVVYTISMDTGLPADAAQRDALVAAITKSLNAATAAITTRLDALNV